ncbi:MAG: M23 family metallopeptidase [Acidimicrobiia bacterium]|jgi:murein DD-endopeptidase MepM/ murein hydrolase activator NlpD
MPASASDFVIQAFPQDPQVTSFSSTFGAPRSGGRRHEGTDLMAPKMTPVYAAADGVVTRIATQRRAGRYLVIDHGDEWETWYVHLNNDTPGTNDGRADWANTVVPGIEVGTQVAAGQHVAWLGDSGNAEGGSPHTHFEIQRNGRSIDPYPYLVPAYEAAMAARAAEKMSAAIVWLDRTDDPFDEHLASYDLGGGVTFL